MNQAATTAPGRLRARPMTTFLAALAVIVAALLAAVGCEGPTGPPGPRGDGPEALTDPSVLPRVIYSYPPAGVEGPYTELYALDCNLYGSNCAVAPVIRIRFNKSMDISSVTGALTLSSPSGNVTIEEGGIRPLGGDIFIVHPADSNGRKILGYADIGERYLLTLDSTAFDVNGNRLSAHFSLAFTPEPSFRIVETNPADGTTLGSISAQFGISFNTVVDSSIFAHLHIDPVPESQSGWWFTDYQRSLHGYASFRGSTTYTVTIDSNATDARGNRLPASFSYSFSSPSFKVVSISPPDGQSGVPPDSYVLLYFSEPVDTTTLRAALRFNPSVDYEVSTYDGRYITVYPRRGLKSQTTYTITIDSTLRSAAGGRLTGGFRSTFTTTVPPPFEVYYTYPADGDTGVPGAGYVSISMNQPVDTLSVPGAFRIDPPWTGTFRFSAESYGFLFVPEPAFASGRSYAITLDTSLQSAYGGRLANPYRISFATRALELYSFSPGNGRNDVAPAYRISAAFNGKIDTATVAGAVSIEPPIAGRFELDPYGFRFQPATVWAPETQYTVRIDTTLQAEGGGALKESFLSTFRTAPFKIIGNMPANGYEALPIVAPVWVFCNDVVDSTSLAASFAMTDSAGNPVTGSFDFPPAFPERFTFQPAARLLPGIRYDVTIGTGFKSIHGYSITSPFHLSFRTAP